MISIAMVGRNDNHGYNLHKRLAISLNSLASLLDDPNDEILFVDCNTRDDLPTLIEAIADTLTEKAKSYLRIFRVRPNLLHRVHRDSPLPISESICKNIAIRRSNEKNQWFLSTTSDVVLLAKEKNKSLRDILAYLEDGFYELPRFGIPEMLWETLDRTQPAEILTKVEEWGRALHLNHAVLVDYPETLYDAPGDFQLCLRQQLFQIYGFNERMVYCYHHDTNLAKRLYLLNGTTHSLINTMYCYHCDHTLVVDYLHRRGRVKWPANSWEEFICDVSSPYAFHQKDTWGLPDEKIEEIRLNDARQRRSWAGNMQWIQAQSMGYTQEFFTPISRNHALCYELDLVFPFVHNHLEHIRDLNVLYMGNHPAMVRRLEVLSQENRYAIFFAQEHEQVVAYGSSDTEVMRKLAMIVVDLFYDYDSIAEYRGIKRPQKHVQFSSYKRRIIRQMKAAIELERNRRRQKFPPAKFLFVGLEHTWAKWKFAHYFELAHTQYASHVSYGYLTQEACTKGKAQIRKIGNFLHEIKHVKKVLRKGKEYMRYWKSGLSR